MLTCAVIPSTTVHVTMGRKYIKPSSLESGSYNEPLSTMCTLCNLQVAGAGGCISCRNTGSPSVQGAVVPGAPADAARVERLRSSPTGQHLARAASAPPATPNTVSFACVKSLVCVCRHPAYVSYGRYTGGCADLHCPEASTLQTGQCIVLAVFNQLYVAHHVWAQLLCSASRLYESTLHMAYVYMWQKC